MGEVGEEVEEGVGGRGRGRGGGSGRGRRMGEASSAPHFMWTSADSGRCPEIYKKHIVITYCKQNFRYRGGHGASSLAICWGNSRS